MAEQKAKLPQVMGILNATPDSFFEGSRVQTEEAIAKRSVQILEEGGEIIDVGAYSTRPGAMEVTVEEELRRMANALRIVRRETPDATVSIDTFRPEVARMAVEEYGAQIINDVSEGGMANPKHMNADATGLKPLTEPSEIFLEVARLKVGYILMSLQPDLQSMIANFRNEVSMLRELGVKDIILDPGYGFGKDVIDGNYAILAQQQSLKDAFPDLPLLTGISRKRMIWQLLGTNPAEALNGTTVLNVLALERGADILRVHDVKAAAEAVKICAQTHTEIIK